MQNEKISSVCNSLDVFSEVVQVEHKRKDGQTVSADVVQPNVFRNRQGKAVAVKDGLPRLVALLRELGEAEAEASLAVLGQRQLVTELKNRARARLNEKVTKTVQRKQALRLISELTDRITEAVSNNDFARVKDLSNDLKVAKTRLEELSTRK